MVNRGEPLVELKGVREGKQAKYDRWTKTDGTPTSVLGIFSNEATARSACWGGGAILVRVGPEDEFVAALSTPELKKGFIDRGRNRNGVAPPAEAIPLDEHVLGVWVNGGSLVRDQVVPLKLRARDRFLDALSGNGISEYLLAELGPKVPDGNQLFRALPIPGFSYERLGDVLLYASRAERLLTQAAERHERLLDRLAPELKSPKNPKRLLAIHDAIACRIDAYRNAVLGHNAILPAVQVWLDWMCDPKNESMIEAAGFSLKSASEAQEALGKVANRLFREQLVIVDQRITDLRTRFEV
jgi:hypothetical protein